MRKELIFLTCAGLMISSVNAAEKKITLNELKHEVAQIKKDQESRSAATEKEQSEIMKKIRELELKLSQADRTAKYEPYSYP